MIELRDYQKDGLDKIRAQFSAGASRVLFVSATGSGKTLTFAAIVEGATRKRKRCLITGHKIEIVEQISTALTGLGVPHGIIAPGSPATPEPVQVASIASLMRRIDRYSDFDLIVLDEAHHAVAGTWRRVIEALPNARVLGVTATPLRLDGRGLDDVFQTMIVGPSTRELIESGYLSRFVCFAPETLPDLSGVASRAGDYAQDQLAAAMAKPVVITSAVDAYEKHAAGKRAVAFGVDVAHSMALAEKLRERGHLAEHLDGNTSRDERRRMLKALASGELKVITNCGLISEGVDVPSVEAVLLAKPTKSLSLYLQAVGRALRPAPGKERAIILDLAGSVYQHGLPDAARNWSLLGQERDQREASGRAAARRCKACAAMNAIAAFNCEACGAELMTRIQRREAEIELKRIEDIAQFEAIRSMRYHEAVRWAGPDRRRLQQIALARGYRSGWVRHVLSELGAA